MSKMKRTRVWERIKSGARKFGKPVCTVLLVAGLMFGSGKARAGVPKPKPTMELESGIGYMHGQKDVRAMILAKSEIPLPLRMKMNATVGMSGSLNNQDTELEEVEAKLSIPIAGLVTASAGYLRSKHGAVENLVNGSVFAGLPFGAAGIAGGYLFDFKTVPLFGVLVWNVHPRLTLNGLGGAVIKGSAGIIGGGATMKLSENATLMLDSWNIINEQGAIVANLKFGIGYRF